MLEDKVSRLISILHPSFENNIDIENKKNKHVDRAVVTNIKSLEELQDFILLILPPGDSISIDDLVKVEALQAISLGLLKTAIRNLIESGDLKPIDGTSIQKIDGDIGVLFRKKKS